MDFKFEETSLANETWYLVTAVIRETGFNDDRLVRDTFVDQLYIGGTDEEEALTMAELAFQEKYDFAPDVVYVDVIFVDIEEV